MHKCGNFCLVIVQLTSLYSTGDVFGASVGIYASIGFIALFGISIGILQLKKCKGKPSRVSLSHVSVNPYQ